MGNKYVISGGSRMQLFDYIYTISSLQVEIALSNMVIINGIWYLYQ